MALEGARAAAPRLASICSPPGPWALGSTIARRVSSSGCDALHAGDRVALVHPVGGVEQDVDVKLSGCTVTPCATRGVSVGSAKS